MGMRSEVNVQPEWSRISGSTSCLSTVTVRHCQPDRRRHQCSDSIITDLGLAERKLQEADQHRTEFLAMLAHELRNPLAGISNALEILRLPGASETDLAWGNDMANRQMRNLTRLTDDLLDVSRISLGKIQLKTERVDVRAVVMRAIDNVSPAIDHRSQRLTARLPDEPVIVIADPTRLEQIFINILNNANKYSEILGSVWFCFGSDRPEFLLACVA